MFSPLEQFQVVKLIPFYVFFDFSFSNVSLYLVYFFFLIIFLILCFFFNKRYLSNNWGFFLEGLFDLVKVFPKNVGINGERYVPLFFALFFFLLGSNLFGLVPYSFTTTSQLALSFGLAISLFIILNNIAFSKHGFLFFGFFIPKGAPVLIEPLLVLIEFISYLFRVVSLSVRLFANIVSGHTLLKILTIFGWSIISLNGVFGVFFFLPVLFVFFFIFLELGIAFLQAYVFTILISIYIADAINIH